MDALLTDDVLIPHLDEVRRRAPALDPPIRLDLRTPKWGGALARFLLLTHWPELLPASVLSEEALFYSRYYWLKRFVTAFTAERGPDAGLEQQVFQMLEQAPPSVDWSLVEELDGRAVADASTTL